MPSYNAKKLHRLADDFERQGARVRRTTKGYFIYAKNGETMAFHTNGSDKNLFKIIAKDAARCGLTMP